MNSIRVFCVVAVAFPLSSFLYGERATPSAPKAACAAFSPSGHSGAVSLKAKKLNLEIVDPSGRSTTLSATLPTEGDECRAAFDHKGRLLTIAVRKQFDTTQGLRILIANVEFLKWDANFS